MGTQNKGDIDYDWLPKETLSGMSKKNLFISKKCVFQHSVCEYNGIERYLICISLFQINRLEDPQNNRQEGGEQKELLVQQMISSCQLLEYMLLTKTIIPQNKIPLVTTLLLELLRGTLFCIEHGKFK